MQKVTAFITNDKQVFFSEQEALAYEGKLVVGSNNIVPFPAVKQGEFVPVVVEEGEEKKPEHNYTGYGSEGSLYKQTKNLNIKEIASLIRKEARLEAKKEGAKVSVTFDAYSGGCSISLSFTELSFNPYSEDFTKAIKEDQEREWFDDVRGWGGNRSSRFIEKFEKLQDKMEAILKKYNYDDSDSMTDYFNVRYYTHCGLDWQMERKMKQDIREGVLV